MIRGIALMLLGAVWRRGADASAGRSAGGARSLFQHLVDGRPPQWRRHEALDGQAEHADRLRAHRWQELSHHGPRPAGGQRTGADAARSAADAHHLRIRRRRRDGRPDVFHPRAARRSRRALAPAHLHPVERRVHRWPRRTTWRSISMPRATWWSTRRTSRCWPRAISSTDCRCCAWARASKPCWPSAATICASIGATSTWPPTRPRASPHLPATVRRRAPRSMPRAACPIPMSLAMCGAEVRCWPTQSRWAR